jgi:hypothetical protein
VLTVVLLQDAGKLLAWSTAAYHDRKPEATKPPTHMMAPPTHPPPMEAPPTHPPPMEAPPTHPPPEHEAHTYPTSSSSLEKPAAGQPSLQKPKPTLGTYTTSVFPTIGFPTSTAHMTPELLPTLVDVTTVTLYRTIDTKPTPSSEPILTLTEVITVPWSSTVHTKPTHSTAPTFPLITNTKVVTTSLLQTSTVWMTTTETSDAVPLYIPESSAASSKAALNSTVLAKLAHAVEDQMTTLKSSVRRKPDHKSTSVKPISPAKTKSGVLSTSRIATGTTTASHHHTTTAATTTRYHTTTAVSTKISLSADAP